MNMIIGMGIVVAASVGVVDFDPNEQSKRVEIVHSLLTEKQTDKYEVRVLPYKAEVNQRTDGLDWEVFEAAVDDDASGFSETNRN